MEKKKNNKIEILKIDVIGRDNKTHKSFVLPGNQHVRPGDEVNWYAHGIGARIIFPREELFCTKEEIIKAGGSLQLTVNPETRRGRYPYIVITDDGDIAIGNSFPLIIVD